MIYLINDNFLNYRMAEANGLSIQIFDDTWKDIKINETKTTENMVFRIKG